LTAVRVVDSQFDSLGGCPKMVTTAVDKSR
jgi:hypothetical protein